jgi:hypothetical protein
LTFYETVLFGNKKAAGRLPGPPAAKGLSWPIYCSFLLNTPRADRSSVPIIIAKIEKTSFGVFFEAHAVYSPLTSACYYR